MRDAVELGWRTPPAWAHAALEHPLALLSDHAHCELGAAAAAQALLARRPEDSGLVERLAAHAAEELRHFRQVHRLLVALGGQLEAMRRNAYADGLLARCRRGSLVDRLLVAALIERRSLERFELLAAAAEERESPLAKLYAELAPSEAGHAALFVELAEAYASDEGALPRLAELAVHEAALVRALPFEPRIHSGPPPVRASVAPEVARA